ncbi:hypothetical protein [Streptomyces sp. BBFR102]|uniref:hypothetical protein n=1 Tax=Streptomyces sp. BBFR102 TaxID=3448171 RepID=UPI003F530F0D
MPSLAVRVHKTLGTLALLLAAFVGLQLHSQPQVSVVALTAHGASPADSGWGP